jgi:hypothetical protein
MKRLTIGCLVALIFASAALAQTSAPRVRRNIEDPQFDLAGYKLAVQILKDRDKDPSHHDDPVMWINNGYQYFASLHDDFDDGGGCMHGSELFLPWHRELLFRFETAIRAAKPGRTDNLALPYWKWSDNGLVLPRAFTEPGSPLRNDTRNDPPSGSYTTDQIQKVIADNDQWVPFAGKECTLRPNCGPGAFCSKCSSRDFGALEAPYHNNMHGYLGVPMENPTTAADDPIFWSFHAYIDLIYQQWQCTHEQLPVCLECNFRAMVSRKVSDVIDIEKQLGYVYDIVAPCRIEVPSALALTDSLSSGASPAPGNMVDVAGGQTLLDPESRVALKAVAGTGTAKAAASNAPAPVLFDIVIPPPTLETAVLELTNLPLPADFSYSGRVFFYPQGTPLRLDDPSFAARYRIDDIGVWANPHAMHDEGGTQGVTLRFDVTHDLRFLARTQPGSTWRVAIVLDSPHLLHNATTTAMAAAQQLRAPALTLILDQKEGKR